MALRKVHIEKLALSIANFFAGGKSPDAISKAVADIFAKNMEAERAIDDEAHKLLDKNRRTIGGDIDEQRAFQMIKKQLAKQKGFVL